MVSSSVEDIDAHPPGAEASYQMNFRKLDEGSHRDPQDVFSDSADSFSSLSSCGNVLVGKPRIRSWNTKHVEEKSRSPPASPDTLEPNVLPRGDDSSADSFDESPDDIDSNASSDNSVGLASCCTAATDLSFCSIPVHVTKTVSRAIPALEDVDQAISFEPLPIDMDQGKVPVISLTPRRVGVVKNLLAGVVTVESDGNGDIFDIGSLVCNFEGHILGYITTLFGPVEKCYYAIKLISFPKPRDTLTLNTRDENSADAVCESDIYRCTIHVGDEAFAWSAQQKMICSEEDLAVARKIEATDASHENDQELPDHVQPAFSDDEKEKEWKRLAKRRRAKSLLCATPEEREEQSVGKSEDSDVSATTDPESALTDDEVNSSEHERKEKSQGQQNFSKKRRSNCKEQPFKIYSSTHDSRPKIAKTDGARLQGGDGYCLSSEAIPQYPSTIFLQHAPNPYQNHSTVPHYEPHWNPRQFKQPQYIHNYAHDPHVQNIQSNTPPQETWDSRSANASSDTWGFRGRAPSNFAHHYTPHVHYPVQYPHPPYPPNNTYH